MVPARHALGALLLEQGHADESVDVFRKDLSIMPLNPWALRGMVDALRRRGTPHDQEEADLLARELAVRQRGTDYKIAAACACTIAAGAANPKTIGKCCQQ